SSSSTRWSLQRCSYSVGSCLMPSVPIAHGDTRSFRLCLSRLVRRCSSAPFGPPLSNPCWASASLESVCRSTGSGLLVTAPNSIGLALNAAHEFCRDQFLNALLLYCEWPTGTD